MNLFKSESEKNIILKEGNNIPLIIGIVIATMIFLGLITSKMWLPDGRSNVTFFPQKEMYFVNTRAYLEEKSFIWNKGDNLGQFCFYDLNVINEKTRIEYAITIKDDKGQELPNKLIKSNDIKTEESSILKQEYVFQFGIPSDFYYIDVTISKEDLQYNFKVDYRDFKKESKLKEKNDTYLVEMNTFKNEMNTLEEIKKGLENELKTFETELKSIVDENRKNELTVAIETKKNEILNKEQEINVAKQKIEQLGAI